MYDTQVIEQPPQQSSSLLGRLLADKPIGELRTLRARLRGEIEQDHEALSQKETDLRELDRVIAERSGETTKPATRGQRARAKAKAKKAKTRRNGAGPASGPDRVALYKSRDHGFSFLR